MRYCISDLHGAYSRYSALLEKIRFSDEDTLYVLGDVVDRGPEPMAILLDMMARPNVIPIIGNHDVAAAYALRLLLKEITEDTIAKFNDDEILWIRAWLMDGGGTTLKDFRRLSVEERESVLEYLNEFSLYEEVSVGGNDYLLLHGGLENFTPERELDDYEPDEIISCRTDYSKPVFSGNRYLVTGHTPTALIPGNPRPDYIYRANNHIAIDCGASVPKGHLGCLCFDTGEEFYIE